jgi:hypothetical protein
VVVAAASAALPLLVCSQAAARALAPPLGHGLQADTHQHQKHKGSILPAQALLVHAASIVCIHFLCCYCAAQKYSAHTFWCCCLCMATMHI